MSETVERHRSAFTREWAEASPAYELPDPPPKTATPLALEELGNRRTKRRQLAEKAIAYGWKWAAHAATSPEGRPSVVLRVWLPGAFPWTHRRAVAYWSGEDLKWVGGFRWEVVGDAVPGGFLPVTAVELATWLADPKAVEAAAREAWLAEDESGDHR